MDGFYKGINESITRNSLKEIDINLYDVCPSISKIVAGNKQGTGFLIKLYKGTQQLLCLMTNEHIIEKEMIDKNEKICFYYDLEKKYSILDLNKDKRFIECNKMLDITIIEILPKDQIKKKYFLIPDLNIEELMNKEIYIPQFPGGKLKYSRGMIKSINNFQITHTASTEFGSSGSPIFLENSTKVIGIHKAGGTQKKENYGILISFLFKYLDNKNLNNISGKVVEKKIDKLIDPNGDIYIGEVLNGLKHGKGKIYNINGSIKYEGDFVNGKREGYGKFIWEDGEYYIGQWMNNLKYGKGIIYYKNGGIKLDCNWVNDMPEGNGKCIWKDGNYYIGQFKNGLRNNKGKIYYKNGNIKYEGDFANGKPEGYGKCIWGNGNYYIGQFKNGLINGSGKIYYKNGNIKYEGDLVDGKPEGYGKYIDENGEYYIGQYKNGLTCGKGILYYKNGNIKYDGEFYNDKREGLGKFIWEDGEYYVGEFKNGLSNGKGKMFYKNGNVKYEGDFVDGKYKGYGKYFCENGDCYIGNFKNGLKDIKGILFNKNGNIKEILSGDNFKRENSCL